ncbi:hypothetical protein [Kribbella sp. NBC_00889]|uniref:hypothetical protein n=1 Tax=Kribbella sp. NBC_00889 TaxID=2975974 RepID=UPI0038666584|nr:dihydrofolate reductase family protein [Kribbella sp. NBC_00889]
MSIRRRRPFDDAAYELKGREQEEATALLLGRVSYQAFSPVWPTTTTGPGCNAMPKYVVSTTLQDEGLVANRGETTILRSLDDRMFGVHHGPRNLAVWKDDSLHNSTHNRLGASTTLQITTRRHNRCAPSSRVSYIKDIV